MESINLLLSQALSPYQVTLTSAGMRDDCLVTVKNPGGAIVVEREVDRAQLSDKRALVDVVDCLLRDLKIAEGRLEPSVIAALRNASQTRGGALALNIIFLRNLPTRWSVRVCNSKSRHCAPVFVACCAGLFVDHV